MVVLLEKNMRYLLPSKTTVGERKNKLLVHCAHPSWPTGTNIHYLLQGYHGKISTKFLKKIHQNPKEEFVTKNMLTNITK